MTARRFIRTVLILATICVSLWQAASFIEVISKASASRRPTQSGVPGTGLPGMAAAVSEGLKFDPALPQRLGAPGPKAQRSDELVVFTPNGTQITDAEREAIRREAERNRLKPPAKSN